MSLMKTFSISCDDCVMVYTQVCDGCVVSFICDREPDDAVIVDAAQERAIRALGAVGLLPPLLHQACG